MLKKEASFKVLENKVLLKFGPQKLSVNRPKGREVTINVKPTRFLEKVM